MNGLKSIPIENILFLDVETVPRYPSYDQIPEREKSLWDLKAAYLAKEDETPSSLYARAGIYAEFGRIICISVGYYFNNELRIKSFYGDDEKIILGQFITLVKNHFGSDDHYLCAHNGKEFDFPYLARRMLIQGLALPSVLDLSGKKPWEVKHLDTMEMWRFGDFKSYTSLDLLASVFNIPSPKEDIAGADIHKVYWEDHDLERIRVYCQRDVITVVHIFFHYLLKSVEDIHRVVIVDS